jgi:glutaredoxin-related protein
MLWDNIIFNKRLELCELNKKLFITQEHFIQFEKQNSYLNKPMYSYDVVEILQNLSKTNADLFLLITGLTFRDSCYGYFNQKKVDYSGIYRQLEILMSQWYNVVSI